MRRAGARLGVRRHRSGSHAAARSERSGGPLPCFSDGIVLLVALLSAGVTPERARSAVDLFERSVDERNGLHAQALATKRDLAELDPRLTREIGQNTVSIAATNERIAEVNARIVETNARIVETNGRIVETNGRIDARIAETRRSDPAPGRPRRGGSLD